MMFGNATFGNYESQQSAALEALHSEAEFQDRARYFGSLAIPGVRITEENFPVKEVQSSTKLAEEVKGFLEEKDTLERLYESEICRRNVQEVIKSLSPDKIRFRMPEDAISPYLHNLFSTICDVPWLAGKVVMAPDDPLEREEWLREHSSRGGVAEIFPAPLCILQYLGLTNATCKHQGWTFNSVGSTVSAFLGSASPFTEFQVRLIEITLKATGPPKMSQFFLEWFDLTDIDDFSRLHRVLLWLAEKNGGRLQVQHSIDIGLLGTFEEAELPQPPIILQPLEEMSTF